ncbi:MAG: Calx-beta domain-containing protein [Marmoricola sp.]
MLVASTLTLTLVAGPAAASTPTYDVAYGSDLLEVLDAYPALGNAPIVMLVHGGAWRARDKSWAPTREAAESLAAEGFATFNLDFPLVDGRRTGFPMQTDSIAEAVEWVVVHAAEYGGDPTDITLIGGSSGGQLVSLAGERINDVTPGRVRSVVSLSGPMDFLAPDTSNVSGDDRIGRDQYLGCSITDGSCTEEHLREVSPRDNIHPDTCPAFLLYNSDQEEIDETQALDMHAALSSAGCTSSVTVVPGTRHGFSLWDSAKADVFAFLRRPLPASPALSGQPPAALVERPYSFALTVTGEPAPTVSADPETLPPGLSVDAAGLVSGVPTLAGEFSMHLRATNSLGETELIAALTVSDLPRLSIGDASVPEGNEGTTQAGLTIASDRASDSDIVVGFHTVDGSAHADSDYVAATGTATLVAGQSTAELTVVVNGDLDLEDAETLSVVLEAPSGAAVVDGQGEVAILNDDELAQPPTITAVTPATVGQGAGQRSVTVSGSNFTPTTTASISAAGVTGLSTTYVSPGTLWLSMTVSATARVQATSVTITTPSVGTATCTNCLNITASPRASAASRVLGQGAVEAPLLLTGSGFAPGARVAIAGVVVIVAAQQSATSLSLTASVGATAKPGWHAVTVTNPDGGTFTCKQCLTVVAGPKVVQATPDTVRRGRTTVITVTGSGFVAGMTLSAANGITFGPVTYLDSTTVTAAITVPSTQQTGRGLAITATAPFEAGSGVGTKGCLAVSR